MATATARGFEDDGYSPREFEEGHPELASLADGGARPDSHLDLGPEGVEVRPVEREVGGLALGEFRPSPGGGIAANTYRSVRIPAMTGGVILRRAVPLIISSNNWAASKYPTVKVIRAEQ